MKIYRFSLQCGRLIDDLALMEGAEVRCSNAQVSAHAPWASAEDLDGCSLQAGDELHVIAPDGVRVRSVGAKERDQTSVTPDPAAKAFELGLATKRYAPSSDARLQQRWLKPPGPDAKILARWVKTKRGRRFIPEGQVRGRFGGGIDRIMILRPEALVRTEEEESEDPDLTGEVALLIAGTEPRGFLPFDKTLSLDDFDGYGDEGDDEGWTEGVLGLQVGGIVDLDGDGIEEILWIGQPSIPLLVAEAWISHFSDGEHHIQDLWSCSYCGCEVILPE